MLSFLKGVDVSVSPFSTLNQTARRGVLRMQKRVCKRSKFKARLGYKNHTTCFELSFFFFNLLAYPGDIKLSLIMMVIAFLGR